jgi:hypothetical protein
MEDTIFHLPPPPPPPSDLSRPPASKQREGIFPTFLECRICEFKKLKIIQDKIFFFCLPYLQLFITSINVLNKIAPYLFNQWFK